jgi:hypothetical protein
MEDFPEAWGVFGAVAYGAWLEQPERALTALTSASLDGFPVSVRQLLILDAAKALAQGKLYAQARALMERIPDSVASPEFRFNYAGVLINLGDGDSARKVLNELVLSRPDDVFAGKARIVLIGLEADKQ